MSESAEPKASKTSKVQAQGTCCLSFGYSFFVVTLVFPSFLNPLLFNYQVEGLLADGQFYEAHQLCRSLHTRYRNKKKPKDAMRAVRDGARVLLEHKQYPAAADLGGLLVVSYTEMDQAPSDSLIETLLSLFNFPPEEHLVAGAYMKSAITWSTKKGDPEGDHRLHLAYARYLTTCKDFASAQRHFLRADCPNEHVTMLLTWASAGYASEADLFLARTCLQYACLQDLKSANFVFLAFTTVRTQPRH